MAVGIAKERPPYVRFEEREHGVNQEASERAGRPIPKVVDFACITPHGSRDIFEQEALPWLKKIKQQALTGQYPLEWANFFQAAYEDWKKGNELPREGTPVRGWQPITKEQQVRLIALGIPTVEDLGQHPDSGLGQIGPDGRFLRDLARSWIAEAKDKGINAREVADLKQRVADQQVTIDSQKERLAALEAHVAALPKAPLKLPKTRNIMDTEAG